MEQLTLQDIKAGLDPKGLVAKVVDVMSTSGHLTEDGVWAPTNAFGRNVTPVTAYEPEGEFRRANRGVKPSKGGLSNVVDYVGYIEAMSLVDDKTIRMVGKGQKQAARAQYDALFAKGLAKQGRRYTVYGSRAADPENFNGFDAKRPAIDNEFCLDGASAAPSAKRSSMYFVAWNTDSGCSMLYPEETTAGIQTEDFGKQIITDPNDASRFLPAWITWFYHDLGFAVKDDRALIRIANVDTDPSAWTEAYMKKILNLVNQATRTMNFTPDDGNIRIYGNQNVLNMFDNMQHELSSVNLTPVTLMEKSFMQSINKVPLRECNEITDAEVAVS